MLRRSAEQSTVFATELRWALIANPATSVAGVNVFVKHQLAGLLQSQGLLDCSGLVPVMARKCCRKVDGLILTRDANSSTNSRCAKFFFSQMTASDIFCPYEPCVAKCCICDPCTPVSMRMTISCRTSVRDRRDKRGFVEQSYKARQCVNQRQIQVLDGDGSIGWLFSQKVVGRGPVGASASRPERSLNHSSTTIPRD